MQQQCTIYRYKSTQPHDTYDYTHCAGLRYVLGGAVHLSRVGGDYLSSHLSRQQDGQVSLTNCCGPRYDQHCGRW